jgi:hypothetical protein
VDEYGNAREKLGVAVEYMDSAPNSKQGLFDAYMVFHTLQPEHLPPGLRTRFEQLKHDLTHEEEVYPDEGKLLATIMLMDEDEERRASWEIREISEQLDTLLPV